MPYYPPELYPNSKTQLQNILSDYYSLTLQLETLQRHILKIQTQNEHKHKFFVDQVEKLKLYIDQCENQIRKREERELILIQRLKELENSHFQEIQELKFSRNSKKPNQEILSEYENIMREKQDEWNRQRVVMITDNESIMRQNLQLAKDISALKAHLTQVQTEKQRESVQFQRLISQMTPLKSQLPRLKQSLHLAEEKIERFQTQNNDLKRQIQELKILSDQTQRKLSEKEQILPISSSCSNCLKLSKMHQTEIEKKSTQIQSLKKDVESLLAFFQIDH